MDGRDDVGREEGEGDQRCQPTGQRPYSACSVLSTQLHPCKYLASPCWADNQTVSKRDKRPLSRHCLAAILAVVGSLTQGEAVRYPNVGLDTMGPGCCSSMEIEIEVESALTRVSQPVESSLIAAYSNGTVGRPEHPRQALDPLLQEMAQERV
jgi:hypothetical protein